MKKVALAAVLAAAPFMAHAETPNPYIECGIGAALFPNTSWAAVISNAIWDLGLTGITSALASPETCNAKRVKTAVIIRETLESLEKDAANGGGTYTVAVTQAMGCPVNKQAAFDASLRANYAAVLAGKDYAGQDRDGRALGMFNTVKKTAQDVAPSCAVAL